MSQLTFANAFPFPNLHISPPFFLAKSKKTTQREHKFFFSSLYCFHYPFPILYTKPGNITVGWKLGRREKEGDRHRCSRWGSPAQVVCHAVSAG